MLILDEFGLYTMTKDQCRDLAELIEERVQLCSTVVISRLKVEDWQEAFGEPTLADAILDRLVHNAYRLTLDGTSIRDTGRSPELR